MPHWRARDSSISDNARLVAVLLLRVEARVEAQSAGANGADLIWTLLSWRIQCIVGKGPDPSAVYPHNVGP